MRRLKTVAFGSAVFLVIVIGWADEAVKPEPRNEHVNFAARLEAGEFIGEEQIRRLYVTAGSNQFGFIVPSGLRVDLSRADRVTLADPELCFFLTLRIVGHSAVAPGATEAFRQQALQYYPGALLTEESNAEAAGARGPMFNLRWKPAEGVDRIVTVAFIPNGAGVLEFSAVSEQAKSSEAQGMLAGLLQRFQSSQGSRLRMETFRQPDYN